MAAVESNLALQWKYISNVNASFPCRILVGWNPIKLNLTCTHQSPQWLTCETTSLSTNATLKISFIYGYNTPAERTLLWQYICQESSQSTSIPWILMGDFNAIIRPADRHGGDITWHHHLDDFNDCIQQSQLLQVPYSGLKYSWHNGQQGDHTIQKKLDWIFCNPCLLTNLPEAHSSFLPRHLSDHSAMILNLRQESYQRHPPFKFLNVWADREDFSAIVNSSLADSSAWEPNIVAQLQPKPTPGKGNSPRPTCFYVKRRSFFKQRSQIQWLQLGDKNTKFFHNSLLDCQARNRIHSLQDEAGNTIRDQKELGKMATKYFQNLLSTDHGQLEEDVNLLFPNTISASSSTTLSLPITNEEIKAALFSIPDKKAAGPDGFNGLFFKKSWHIIGADFTEAVRFFFSHNSMPHCVNATRIALVPKIENPACMNDYRPISCCNVMYKCISKIINLMHNYHLNNGAARCALKVDLRKAFDTVSWEFILAGLQAIGGIRQGDPLSPYLFVLAMEGLADDLMLFYHADTTSVGILKDSLNKFSSISGLKINLAKSSIYLTGIGDNLKGAIRDQVGFQQSALPVRYLGIPLISTRLTHADCLPLVERIITRINSGHLSPLHMQDVSNSSNSCFSIQVYWSTMFILPCSSIRKLARKHSCWLSLEMDFLEPLWSQSCLALPLLPQERRQSRPKTPQNPFGRLTSLPILHGLGGKSCKAVNGVGAGFRHALARERLPHFDLLGHLEFQTSCMETNGTSQHLTRTCRIYGVPSHSTQNPLWKTTTFGKATTLHRMENNLCKRQRSVAVPTLELAFALGSQHLQEREEHHAYNSPSYALNNGLLPMAREKQPHFQPAIPVPPFN
ncbi:hypothetical protein NC652_022464 [Populus alba x Populus x berolinensis]|nr:hypothetical protein NC652_022464 [Populus alba x Populus x berolinensis]